MTEKWNLFFENCNKVTGIEIFIDILFVTTHKKEEKKSGQIQMKRIEPISNQLNDGTNLISLRFTPIRLRFTFANCLL